MTVFVQRNIEISSSLMKKCEDIEVYVRHDVIIVNVEKDEENVND